jgi:hypothetical protein
MHFGQPRKRAAAAKNGVVYIQKRIALKKETTKD